MQGYFVVKACDIKFKKVSFFILVVLFSVVLLLLLVISAVVRKLLKTSVAMLLYSL